MTRHLQVLLATLGRLTRNPVSSLMTASVIGIAVALPAGLHLLVKNLQNVSSHWDSSASISLFLRGGVADEVAQQLVDTLSARPDIAAVQLVRPDQALREFREFSGFGDALELLDENPLPHVVLIQPAGKALAPGRAERLSAAMEQLPEVELAQLDLQWLRRLHAFTQAAERGIAVLAGLLGLAVMLTVGNTIRLEIQNRRAEIEIACLVGATNAFIRRPFLYTGLWYGLAGGLIAWLFINLAFRLLQGPLERLAGLYQSAWQTHEYSHLLMATLLLGSPLLGWLGAWLAVNRQLVHVEPN
jgi:cell division transport system permease protein